MFRALLLAAVLVTGCSQTPEVASDRTIEASLQTVRAFEEQRIRAQPFQDVQPQDLEIDPDHFDHFVAIQDVGFQFDTIEPASRLQRVRYAQIEAVRVEWDPIGVFVPIGTLGILGPHWYTAWADLEGGRRIFLGRSRSSREVFPMWMNPGHYLSVEIEDQVEAFEFLRRRAHALR